MKRRLLAGAAIVLVAALATPSLMFERWVDGTRACLASIETRQQAELPRCEADASALAIAKRTPWLGHAAERMAEERDARMAVMRYLDAAVGRPDKAALAARFEATRLAGRSVLAGSGRLRLDELGEPLPIPEPGVLAQQAGHRRMLIDRGSRWIEHYTQLHALEAALLEGELERAIELGARYAETPNGDLAVVVAALLCIGKQYQHGMKMAVDVEALRAERRNANFATNFGAARVVIEACAVGGGLKAPDVPRYGYAGSWDHRARIMVMRLRRLQARHADGVGEGQHWYEHAALRATVGHVREMLRSGHPQRYRLELLAAVAESVPTAKTAAALARPLEGEPTMVERMPADVGAWLDRPADAPNVVAEQLEKAAKHLLTLADDAFEEDADTLREAAKAMWLHAAMRWSARADERAARRCLERADAPALFAAQAALLRGAPADAVELMAGAAAPEGPLGLRHALLEAELLRSTQAAQTALALASEGAQPWLVEHAQWLALTLLPAPPQRPTAVRVPLLASSTPAVGGGRAQAFSDLMATWRDWLAAGAERRAARYRLFHHRGHAPRSFEPYLFAAGKLVGDDGSVEAWLDALAADDARAISLRRYAFARWRVASWREDAAAAAAWRQRLDRLLALAAKPDTAELFQTMRL